MSEEDLINVRREKHHKLNDGKYPLYEEKKNYTSLKDLFSNDDLFKEAKTSLDVSELGDHKTICGKISVFRKVGGLSFIKIIQGTHQFQVILKKGVTENYANLEDFDIGDFVEVAGPLCVSKAGERSLLGVHMSLLTKSLKAFPKEYFGISDPELAYRKRYVDLMSSEESRSRFVARSAVISDVRVFLKSQSYLEVETPILNSIASGANARTFETKHIALNQNMHLRIAPELYLKRMLVGGFDKVFEIGKNFRNEGTSTRHNPEFTMVEFYSAYSSLDSAIQSVKDIIEKYEDYSQELGVSKEIFESWKCKRKFTFKDSVVVRMLDVVKRSLTDRGFDFSDDLIVSKETSEMTFGERVSYLFDEFGESDLTKFYQKDGLSVPVFVTMYPKEVSPLARESDVEKGFCDRFELFIDGKEIANAFCELNDPEDQKQRFINQSKNIASVERMAYDEDYIEALEYGLPPTVGCGIGLDRLVMLVTASESIKEVILFPTLKKV